MPDLDPETIDKLRRGFPLRMDAQGRFFLADDAITHPGVVALFRKGLDLSDDGEPILRVDEQWTYVELADCVLRALHVDTGEDGQPVLRLDDGRRVALDASTLWEQPDRGLRCTAPSQPSQRPLTVRFSNAAQMDLDQWIVWPDEGRPVLRIGTTEHVIPDHG